MSDYEHHAIVVTGSYPDDHGTHWTQVAWEMARRMFPDSHRGLITAICDTRLNNVQSFAILPDGSQVGWEEAEMITASRVGFIAWLESIRDDDGGCPVKWVEVVFGADYVDTRVIDTDRFRQNSRPGG